MTLTYYKHPKLTMKKLLILTFISFWLNGFYAQNTLEKAWNLFNGNKLNEAITQFESAKTQENLKEEALIGLTLTYEELLKPNLAKESFLQFIEVSKNPYPYIYSMWYSDGMALGTDYDRQTIAFYLNILRDEKADGMMKAMINERIGGYYRGQGEMVNGRNYADAIGSIKTWQTLGSFENISASGFNKDFGAVAHPEASHNFKNKRNVDVKWFDIKEVKNSRWIDLTYHHYTDNSIIYSQTFCNSPSEQQVQLRIGTSGSVKVWLNDNLVISDNKETNNNLDTYIQEVKLNKGTNRILVQIGSSEIDRSNFMCRITDDKGNPIENLTYSFNYSEYSKEYSFKGKSIRNPYEIFFEDKIKEEPSKVLNHILLAKSYWRNRKSFETRKSLSKAEELAPKSTYILTQKAYVLVDENNSTGLSKLLEQIKETDPESYLALDLQYDEYMDQENYEEAEKIVNTLKSRYGYNAELYNKKITLASKNQEVEKLKNLVYQAYKKYPNNYDIVGLKYAVEKQINKSPSAYKILTKYDKKNYNTSAKIDLAGYYFDRGLPYKGIQIYQNLVKNHPAAPGYRRTLAKISFAMNNYQGAIKYYNECLEIAPYISTFYEGIGQAYEEMNQDDKAIENYKKAIELSPNDYEVREKLRILEDKEKLFSVFETPKSPEELLKDSPTSEDYPEDQSIMLLEEDQKIVYKDGASEEKHYRMVKMLNTSGVDDWKEYSIRVYGNQRLIVEEAKVYKKDGSKIDAETNYNYLVFTDLEVGDAIYIVYKLENYNSGKLAKHFWDKHYFNYFMPVKRNAYNLLIHKDKKFQHKVINSRLEPTIEDHGDFTLYKWVKNDVPATKGEPYMPPLTDVGEILHISSFQNWSEISDWYTDLAETKQEADFEVKEKVAELFKGKENLTDKEKALIIYNYIVKDIRYSSISFRQSGLIPQKASSVINTKLGDCKDVSTLFVTMCKEVGIDANLVLVNTRDEGDEDLYFPSISFNHCIAKVNFDDESQYIELTSDLLPFSTFGNSLKNATALNIVEGSDIIKLNSKNRVPNTCVRKSLVSFNGDQMLVKKESTKGGYLSASMRSTYRDIGKEQQEKEMTEAIQGKYLKTKLKNLEFDSTLTISEPFIHYKYSYTVDDAFNDVGGIYIIKLPWADDAEMESFISTETREFPIALWKYSYKDSEEELLEITLPSNKTIVKVPENITYTNNFFDYNITYSLKGNKLLANRTFKFKVDTISPKDYTEFKTAYEKVIKADAKQLAFNEK